MSDIDWRAVAQANNMTKEEFESEIFSVALALGAMRLEEREKGESLKLVNGGHTLFIVKGEV